MARDHDGQQLAYVYFEDEPGRRSAAKLLTKDGADRGGNRLSRAYTGGSNARDLNMAGFLNQKAPWPITERWSATTRHRSV